MKQRVIDWAGAILDWLDDTLAANVLGAIAALVFAWLVGESSFIHLWHGGSWTDVVFSGMVNSGQRSYMHVWFLVPASVGIAVWGLVFLYQYNDGPRRWRQWILRFYRQSNNQ